MAKNHKKYFVVQSDRMEIKMKRIMTVQDISCVGRCSLTVALPIISAAGVECGVLPTAVLSTHTAFKSFTFRDLTDEIEPISDTFLELGIDFDAIYTGYLGSHRQLSLVGDFIDRFKKKDSFVLIDPVMADHGVLYKGFTEEFAKNMAALCAKADLVVPNITEAAFMLGIPYNPDYDEDYIKWLLKELTGLGCPRAALTGISFEENNNPHEVEKAALSKNNPHVYILNIQENEQLLAPKTILRKLRKDAL